MSDSEITEALTKAGTYWLLRQGLAVHQEIGLAAWGRRRADLLGLSMRGDLTIVEVKASKSDLLRDKKMVEYLACCNRMYLLVPPYLVDTARGYLEGVPGCGLLTLGKGGWCYAEAPAKRQKVAGATRRELITRMAWRAGVSKANTRRQRIFLPETCK